MRRVVCREFGPPERLVVEEAPDPQPGPGEVLVGVRAAGAWAGQDSGGNRALIADLLERVAALLSIHARVAGTKPSTWEDPSLVQLWGPRFNVFVVAARDLAFFSLGVLAAARHRGTADRRPMGRLSRPGYAGHGRRAPQWPCEGIRCAHWPFGVSRSALLTLHYREERLPAPRCGQPQGAGRRGSVPEGAAVAVKLSRRPG
ncbi:MAG: hypothetical protein ACTHPS_02130 [Streptosporangiaceae bacterium]